MNLNYAIQNAGVLTWDGAATDPPGPDGPVFSTVVDIRRYVGFAFTFRVIEDLLFDTVMKVEAAEPEGADPCLPGAFAPIPEVLTCTADFGAVPGAESTILIPNGTKKGSICTASLPCRPGAFIRVVAGSGDITKVQAVVTLHGPR